MKEFIEKLNSKLKEKLLEYINKANDEMIENGHTLDFENFLGHKEAYENVLYEIVNQLAEEYKSNLSETLTSSDGWIPVADGLPESGVSVIVSYKDRFLSQADGTCEGWYDATNMIWHLTDYEYSDNAQVIAWRERLTPYQPEGE